MIIVDGQAHQQMTLHFQLSLQCNVSPIMGVGMPSAGYILCLLYSDTYTAYANSEAFGV